MAHQFKKGDKVRAVDGKYGLGSHLTLGKVYEVICVPDLVHVLNDAGWEESYFPERFEPATKRFGEDEHIPAGAKIRCVEPVDELVFGQVYTAESMNSLDNVVLKEIGGGGFYPSRFELVEPPKALTFDEVEKLQLGQKLICMTQESHGTKFDLKVGAEYEVVQNGHGGCVVVRGPGAPGWGIYGDRFALAPEAKPRPLSPDDIPTLKPGQKLLCLDAGGLGRGLPTGLTAGEEYEFVGTVLSKDHVKVRDDSGFGSGCAYFVHRFALAEPAPVPEVKPAEPEAPETVIVVLSADGKPLDAYPSAADVPATHITRSRRVAVYTLVDVGHIEQQKLFVSDSEED